MINQNKKKNIKEVVFQNTQNYLYQCKGNLPSNLYEQTIEQVEVGLIISVLKYTENNISQSAKILGITRNTLRKKINIYSSLIEVTEEKLLNK